jgi:hypothetical protein
MQGNRKIEFEENRQRTTKSLLWKYLTGNQALSYPELLFQAAQFCLQDNLHGQNEISHSDKLTVKMPSKSIPNRAAELRTRQN